LDKVLITGTSHGIGRATAILFILRGFEVIGIDKDKSYIYPDSRYTHLKCDVRNKLPVMLDKFTYIINNAGVLYDKEGPMSVNLYGMFNIEDNYVKQSLGVLKAIVNVGSIAGINGIADREYVCSKGAVVSYTAYLANELAGHGVRVNCVVPGAGDTDMNELYKDSPDVYEEIANQNLLKRWGLPEEFAKAIYYLCEDATFTTGTSLIVDGGELIKNKYIRYPGETRPYDK
jgi:NAD(P)-dependent dehydrogenase (short-subunit alcohol dehydrogenase family)